MQSVTKNILTILLFSVAMGAQVAVLAKGSSNIGNSEPVTKQDGRLEDREHHKSSVGKGREGHKKRSEMTKEEWKSYKAEKKAAHKQRKEDRKARHENYRQDREQHKGLMKGSKKGAKESRGSKKSKSSGNVI